MNFSVLDIPDDDQALAGWLERELVGLNLANITAGLLAFQTGSEAAAASLTQVLGAQRQAVLDRGLAALSPEQLRSLLRQPRLLPRLQEELFIHGGPHWDRVARASEHQQLVYRGWERVSAGTATLLQTQSVGGGTPARRQTLARFASIAALLLLGLFGWWQFQGPGANRVDNAAGDGLAQQRPISPPPEVPVDPTPTVSPAPTGWGWNKPGALEGDVPAADYLRQLADGGQAWFNKRPESAADLKTRLEQFRKGCQTLIDAQHPQLAVADRDWLRERCGAWAGKIDEHIAAIDSGADVQAVRDAADETVNKLVNALRQKAETLA
ncbi:MAG: hypothetical protein R3B90_09970 [Planctomycetaceae bacterium]